VAKELAPRLAPPEQVRTTPAGLVCLAHSLDVDISATTVRALLKDGDTSALAKATANANAGAGANVNLLVSPVVLDYIQHHNLYKS
jgi:nicotinate-nucleotide adenylyltransferase